MIDTLRKDFFMDNIFLKNQAPETLDSFLSYSEGGRDNLGNTIPVMVYRMLEKNKLKSSEVPGAWLENILRNTF